MRTLKLTIAYDGSRYVGWQVQPNGVSVQQKLEEAWTQTTQESIRVVASGRTDSGVHALGQVCSVQTRSELSCQTLARALNANTPEDISVLEVVVAPADFHAIRDATRKTYRYQIQFGRVRNPLTTHNHWFCPFELNIDSIRSAAKLLEGEHDFASFQAVGAERKSTIRHLSKISIQAESSPFFNCLYLELTSNGFLYNMVRNIVGTLIQVGKGSKPPEWVGRVLDCRDRSFAGPTAPAHGLVLVNVEYDCVEFVRDS